MRKILLALPLLLCASPALADHYTFDKEHTTIMFCISHLGFSEMVGIFTSYDGSFIFDENQPEKSSVDVSLRPSGIHTSSSALDSTLQGKDFFNSSKFPEIHFTSNGVKVTGDHEGVVTGNLTMLGVTKPVKLKVHFNKAGYHPLTNLYVAGFSADTTIKRSDFGMTYLTSMVGDDVKIEIQTEGINDDRKKNESIKKH